MPPPRGYGPEADSGQQIALSVRYQAANERPPPGRDRIERLSTDRRRHETESGRTFSGVIRASRSRLSDSKQNRLSGAPNENGLDS